MASHPSKVSALSDSLNYIPEDVLLKIFEKLPCESVFICKAVSKRWKTLISNPSFIQHYILNNNRRRLRCHDHPADTVTLFFRYKEADVTKWLHRSWSSNPKIKSRPHNEFRSLSFLPCYKTLKSEAIQVVASFNDLLLCSESPSSPNVYYICNPLTKQWLKLPPAPVSEKENWVGFFCYISDPGLTTNICYDYKVVIFPKYCTSYCSQPEKINLTIFCSKNGRWIHKPVQTPSNFSKCKFAVDGIVACNNGNLYWVNSNIKIMSFNLIKNPNCASSIDWPSDMRYHSLFHKHLGVCKGRLRLVEFPMDYPPPGILKVWELVDHVTGKWHLVHEREMNFGFMKDFALEGNRLLDTVRVVAFDPSDEDVIYLNLSNFLVSFNLKNEAKEIICDLESDEDRKKMTVIGGLWAKDLFPIWHQCWPTPVPSLTS